VKVLIVCSGTKNKLSPFIKEQMESLMNCDIHFAVFQITRSGVVGYLNNLRHFKEYIKNFKPDIIHAHYGLSGLFANLQRKVPVITTYHGSDINDKKILFLSKICIRLSKYNIFVSNKLKEISKIKNKYAVIPCGVDLNNFICIEQKNAREQMNFNKTDKLILFAGAFDNKIKNPLLAQNAVKLLKDAKLIELKDYTREEVNILMNAVDVALMTSYAEGSPQFVKEAIACNCPVVATNVGDVAWLFGNEPGYFITDFNSVDCADKIRKALTFVEMNGKPNGRQRIIDLKLDRKDVAYKLYEIYKNLF